MPLINTKGRTQSPDHIEKRKRFGPDHHHWKGDAVTPQGGRSRAERTYVKIGPCVRCGAVKSERHHVDGNTANNEPSNIEILCRRCHLLADGRLAASIVRLNAISRARKKAK